MRRGFANEASEPPEHTGEAVDELLSLNQMFEQEWFEGHTKEEEEQNRVQSDPHFGEEGQGAVR
eukprot:CAMPEP_0172920834 /NCGR_PEP_ID=MMETSP1075-20121228/204809_1 /TAXON_ID=2916 /ORGANISM="Ceratium fusus, Strain PA161109" /LENGTH=63 /DNA_ID=CAMNT_0013780913 /DNA_START=30 /DNA_END=221 /DNA_ORIENTATION=+